MKKCASCTKDLPEAAQHCVFCGAKQPPSSQPAMAKTVMGYSSTDMVDALKAGGNPMPANAPSAAPYSPSRPQPASQPPPGYGAAPVAPASQGGSQPNYPPGHPNFVPVAPAHAATVFAQGGQPAPAPAQNPGYQPRSQNPSQPPPHAGAYQVGPIPVAGPIPAASVPPYLASQTAERAGYPIEPWKDSLRLVMFVWGVVMLAAFATPTGTDPIGFNWDTLLHGEGLAKLPMLLMASVGLLGIVIAAIPMQPLPRGVLAALLGLAGIFVPVIVSIVQSGDVPDWTVLVKLGAVITLIPGLLVRHEYRESTLPRVLVTIGVLCVLVPLLVPAGGEIPVVGKIKALIDAPGSAKVTSMLEFANIVLVVLALLAWMPAPTTGGAKIIAFLLILWPALTNLTGVIIAGGIGDAISKSPYTALLGWVQETTYIVLAGYGLATMFGKKLE